MHVVGPRILVEKVPEDRVFTKSGSAIQLVLFSEEETNFALVHHTGRYTDNRGRQHDCDVDPGNIVVIKKYCGTPARINDIDMHFVDFDDVLAIIDND